MNKYDELTALLRKELESSKHLSVRGLASKCKVGYTTMRRVIQGEGVPADDTIVSIVINLLPIDEAVSFFKTHLPNYAKLFSRFNTPSFGKNEGDLGVERLSERQFLALVIVYSRGRVSRSELVEIMGNKIELELDSLVNANLFLSDGEFLSARSEHIVYHSVDSTLDQIKYTVDNFNKAGMNSPGNAYSLNFEGLNDGGLDKVHRAVFRFIEEVQDIMFDPNNKGDHITAVALIETVLVEGKK